MRRRYSSTTGGVPSSAGNFGYLFAAYQQRIQWKYLCRRKPRPIEGNANESSGSLLVSAAVPEYDEHCRPSFPRTRQAKKIYGAENEILVIACPREKASPSS